MTSPDAQISVPPADSPTTLLLSFSAEVEGLEFDLYQRYSAAARMLERMLAECPAPVNILEIGPNFRNPLKLFLDPARVRLRFCDVLPVLGFPDFVQVDADGPLPFGDAEFDAVIALEVLEHMPAERRRSFLGECLRVAKHGVVLSCPNGVPEVVEAEEVAAESFLQRHGRVHPYLEEHRRFGLPREEDVCASLRELDCPFAVFDNAPLDVWLALLLLSENLHERNSPSNLQGRLNAPCFAGLLAQSTPYRKIYVLARNPAGIAALTPVPRSDAASAPTRPTLPQALHHMAHVAAEALAALEQEHHRERIVDRAVLHRLRAEIDDLRDSMTEIRSQLGSRQEEVRFLQAEMAARENDMLTWRRRQYALISFVTQLTQSRFWRWTEPLRYLTRLTRSRGFNTQALLPWTQLEPLPDGVTWRVAGPRAHFIVPCYLPAGWLRIRLRMSSDQVGSASVAFDSCAAMDDTLLVERIPVHGRADSDFYIYLPQPVYNVRFHPLDVTGKVTLDSFELEWVSPASALVQALRSKFDVLKRHRLLLRSAGRGLAMLLRGQFVEFGRKLHAGLLHARSGGGSERVPEAVCQHELLSLEPRGGPTPSVSQKLDIVYVLRSIGMCGGVKVVLEHCSRLYARGHNVAVYYLEGNPDWFTWRLPAFRFSDLAALRRALARFRGVKVATWYETAPWVAESLQPGDRGYYLVQDIEESYARNPEQAETVLATYRLGLRPITEGTWVREQLRERFGLDSTFVSIGLDHELFKPRMALRHPWRILTQTRTWSGGAGAGARIKGWDVARAVVLRCHDKNPRTVLTTFSIEDKPSFPEDLTHLHYQKPSDNQLAELYSQAGAYLLTSSHEGFGLTAAEAMACGCPLVATRADGNEEFCIDEVTALMAPAGDVELLARQCLRLQTDHDLARTLTRNARAVIRNYTWERVVDRLEREFLQQPGPEIVIETPRSRGVAEVAEEVNEAPALPAVSSASASSHGVCRRGGEYPDLHLRDVPALDWTIIIPTVNDASLAPSCIESCRRFLPADASVEFLVVDDGSELEVVAELRQAADALDFELLENHQNLGFSAAVNRGLRQARGQYIVLCNNDVVFFQPWLEPLKALFEDDARIGVIGAKLLYPDGTIQHAGMDKIHGTLHWVHSRGKMPGTDAIAGETRYVWSVTGALFALRRETLDRLGGLSTAYGTAYEDLDYCLYTWASGLRVAYCAEVVARHFEGKTRGVTEAEKIQQPLWAERERAGKAYFEKKWAFLRHVEDFQSILSLLNRSSEDSPLYSGIRELLSV